MTDEHEHLSEWDEAMLLGDRARARDIALRGCDEREAKARVDLAEIDYGISLLDESNPLHADALATLKEARRDQLEILTYCSRVRRGVRAEERREKGS